MSILLELNRIVDGLGILVETGVFKDKAPDEYVVITPLSDTFDIHADNRPQFEIQEARLSLFSKNNYQIRKNQLVRAFLDADFTVTDRRYIGHEDDTDYHHYAIDVAKEYELQEV
ncbi:hypothetical protein ACSXBU_00490 [Clostridium perfringens]|uniref:Uncharacterized protein n=2 Tax=Clostridiaceae TaxID=31979 RepID=A0A1M6NL09_9CLOT|nr:MULTISPECIES: hypothetical protein [Clostridiaceae]CDM68544.1 hypothetical protein CM240_1385 [Clostridium bornimense]SHJ96418.1 hypothetical protein SAMN02745248_01435 [Hathewaya proteolytica DSM 3090]HEL1311864.1 hypothetical protein [Streptococcus equi subsp. zooepidemicus]